MNKRMKKKHDITRLGHVQDTSKSTKDKPSDYSTQQFVNEGFVNVLPLLVHGPSQCKTIGMFS